MNTEPTYHIDVTPEEDQLFKDELETTEPRTNKIKMPSKAAFVKVFCVVFGLHIAAAVIIGFGSFSASAANVSEDKQYVGQSESSAQTANATTTAPVATPAPTPVVKAPTINDWPKPTSTPVSTNPPIITKVPSSPVSHSKDKQTSNNKFTTQYIVKKGDTITSIAKKYKLNVDRLIKLNNIKDPKKLQVGQVLKFM